jgi:hypothetical protein
VERKETIDFNMRDSAVERIVLDALSKSEFDDVSPSFHKLELEWIPTTNLVSIGSTDRRDTWIREIYDRAAPDLKASKKVLYHFKSLERAKQILSSGEIGACSLFSNWNNDYAEGEEFLRRYGSLYPLIPRDYVPASSDSRAAIGPSNRPVDDLRNNVFVLCMTQSFRNARFWRDYVDCGAGVALELEYSPLTNQKLGTWERLDGWLRGEVYSHDLFELRKVCYDTTGYLFDFLNEISFKFHHLKLKEKVLFIPGLTQFAAWYKRGRYRWENEVRIVFDMQWIGELQKGKDDLKAKIGNYVLPDSSGWLRVPIPITNSKMNRRRAPLMNLSLKRVVCGEKVSQTDIDSLNDLLREGFDHVHAVPLNMADEDII